MADASADVLRVRGAREHNLRGVDLELPKGKLICFTGVSGSGKSSLAFDTLYAEGQRRYIESLSSYARQFLGELPRPDVDQISGLAPSISIQQRTGGWNPRSTVGTITQIHDYLRVLYARAGYPRCPSCGKPISAQTPDQMVERMLALPEGTRFTLLAPKVRGQKGEYRDLFEELLRQGYIRARVDGQIIELANPPPLDRYRRHDIEVVVDRLVLRPGVRPRLAEALELALSIGAGSAIVAVVPDGSDRNDSNAAAGTAAGAQVATPDGEKESSKAERRSSRARVVRASRPPRSFRDGQDARSTQLRAGGRSDILLSSGFACTACGLSFEPPNPQMFSFNSPQGMCPECDGLGTRFDFDPDLLVPDPSRNFLDPCVVALRTPPGRWRRHLYEGVAEYLGIDLRTPWRDLPPRARRTLLYGAGDAHITFTWRSRHGVWRHGGTYAGVVAELHEKYRKTDSAMVRAFYEQFMRSTPCASCRGARLKPEALAVVLAGRTGPDEPRTELNIDQVCRLPVNRALEFFRRLDLDGVRTKIAAEPLKEIRARLQFLVDVGLEYLTLDRAAPTLAGGESQRIRLASQIGCGLTGVLYVLDEPSIGLHPRDNRRLLASLQRLRDMGNTVIVVEHDRDTMLAADHLVDFGPGAGMRGGEVVAQGTLERIASTPESVTGAYLSGRRAIEIPPTRRPVSRQRRAAGRRPA